MVILIEPLGPFREPKAYGLRLKELRAMEQEPYVKAAIERVLEDQADAIEFWAGMPEDQRPTKAPSAA